MYDLLLRNATLIDGSGSSPVVGDLAVRGDRIAAMGPLGSAESRRTLDVNSRVVAPGFIDVHNHSDGHLLNTPHFLAKTSQGFTSEVLMADGISYAPVSEPTWREWFFYLRSLNGLRMDEYRGWESLEDYMELIEGGTVQNAAAHLPYANVRSLSCGFRRIAADDYHMRQILADIRAGMEQGAVGLSTGIDYIVQCFSTTAELVEACRAVADFDGLYVSHIRYKKGLLAGLEEALEIGRRAGVRVHISHLKGQSGAEVDQLLDWLDRARRDVDLSFDIYPYQPGSTMLSYLVPYETWEDGPLASAARLAEPENLLRFRRGLEAYRLDLDRIRIAWTLTADNAVHQGKRLSEYVDESGLPPEEALARLLIEERMAVLLVFDEGEDRLVHPLLQHDLFMLGSDGIYFEHGLVHPRALGSATRVVGPCVRDAQLFPLEVAVRKLTRLPADRFRLTDRGRLEPNAFADIVVFDPQTVSDRATYDDPQQRSVGIEQVFVNGTQVIADGQPVEGLAHPLPGRYLRRGTA